MNKNIIIAILAIILIAVVGYVFISGQATTDGKLNTQINFVSESELQNGDQVVIELKDAKGTPLPNQIVNLTMKVNGAEEKYAVYTNAEGKAFLILNGEQPGDIEITAAYGGNDQLNPCTATQKITIKEGTSDQPATNTNSNSTANSSNNGNSTSTSTSQSSQSSQAPTKTYYDEELNVYYDENGVVVGGQSDGANIYDLRNNPPVVDEEGNLV